MNLREVREAAERIVTAKFRDVFNDGKLMAELILATIDPEPEAVITAEWLREEWGFEQQDLEDEELYYIIPGVTYSMLQDHDDNVWTFYLDSDSGDSWPHDLHARQQFADLARCLGIKCCDTQKQGAINGKR